MYSINGYIEGNIPADHAQRGSMCAAYLMADSNEEDVHMAHWHGNTVTWNSMRTDTVPWSRWAWASADMVPDAEGIWLFHCHVNDHYAGGILGRYQVLP